ncbi:NAD(P)H-binding protein [Streptomyces ovatisporus]|uniref:NAD(P)H-binding protein n=1 Tax=Streptomyces ovatisporus TaxID=1128682 RepID=A0ABV9A7F1_9ACTN
MKIVLFGASGMIGQGVLRECLRDGGVTDVVCVVRAPLGVRHPRLREIVQEDFSDFSSAAGEFADADACFFCLGVSAAGRSEEEYRRITYDWTLAAAHALTREGGEPPAFVYVSGAGTDSTGNGRVMWARVKGRTENALLAMPLHAYMFRPGYIHPLNGETSRTPGYRRLYAALSWLYPVLRRVAPKQVTTTEHLGRAMLAVARRRGGGERVLHSPQINAAALE